MIIMAGDKKSSSRENHVSGLGHLCGLYSCFLWRCSVTKKRRSLSDPKSRNKPRSFDDAFQASADSSEEIPSKNENKSHELRSKQSNNEVHPNNSNLNSPTPIKHTPSRFSRTASPLSKQASRASSPLSRQTGRASRETQSCKLRTSSILRESGEMTKPPNVSPLKRRNWSHQLDTKNLGQGPGSMARSGPLLRTVSRSTSPAIVYSRSNGLVNLLTVEESLECSLEELCFGCVKSITITRAVIANNGQIEDEEETLSIKVKPGWTKGTRITFEGTKNEEKGTQSCDVIFVVTEKKHELYSRVGDDLELSVSIPLLQALTGCNLSIPLLGGDKMKMILDEVIEHGCEKIIEGQGMPNSKDKGHRGNLKIKFLVDFPEDLTEEQKREIASILRDSC